MKEYFISFLSQILENWDLNLWLILRVHYGTKLLNCNFSFIPGFIFSLILHFFCLILNPHYFIILGSTPFVNKTQHKCCFICLQLLFSYIVLITTCLRIYSFVYLLSVSNPFHTRMQAPGGQGLCFVHCYILRI